MPRRRTLTGRKERVVNRSLMRHVRESHKRGPDAELNFSRENVHFFEYADTSEPAQKKIEPKLCNLCHCRFIEEEEDGFCTLCHQFQIKYEINIFPIGNNMDPGPQPDDLKRNSPPRTKRTESTDYLPQPAVVVLPTTYHDHEHALADYEADHSDSGEEETKKTKLLVGTTQAQQSAQKIKMEIIDPLSLPIPKIEDESDSSDMSMMIMSDDESIKPEPQKWRRAEDKHILEVLKQHLSPEERKDRTILEIIEEKNILQLLFESLTEKSMEDITERVLYLLKVLEENLDVINK